MLLAMTLEIVAEWV